MKLGLALWPDAAPATPECDPSRCGYIRDTGILLPMKMLPFSRTAGMLVPASWISLLLLFFPIGASNGAWGAGSRLLQARDSTRQGGELVEQGNFVDAEAAVRRALALQESVPRVNQMEVAATLDRLALVELAQIDARTKYDLEPVRRLYRRALRIREKALGHFDIGVAKSLDDLAGVYVGFAEDDEPVGGIYVVKAQRLLRRSLAIREARLGRNHPDVAVSLYNLAMRYSWRVGDRGAEPLYRRALAIREKAFGRDSLPVAEALLWIASLRINPLTALALRKRALAIQEAKLGQEALQMVPNLRGLAELYEVQGVGQKSDAEPLLAHVLSINEKAHGEGDPSVSQSLSDLSRLDNEIGRPDEANALLRRKLVIDEGDIDSKSLLPPQSSLDRHALRIRYDRQDDPSVVDEIRVIAPPVNLIHIFSRSERLLTIGISYEGLNDLANAERFYDRAFSAAKDQCGPDNMWSVPAMERLASLYRKINRTADADLLTVQVSAINEKFRLTGEGCRPPRK